MGMGAPCGVLAGFAYDKRVYTRRAYHELFLDLAEAVEARLELEVVVGSGLGDGGDNGDVVALGADVVRRRDAGDVDIYHQVSISLCIPKVEKHTVLAPNLGLGDDQLSRIGIVGASQRVLEDADGS